MPSLWRPRVAAALLVALGLTPASLAEAQVTPYIVSHDFNATWTRLANGTNHVPVAYGTQPAWDEGAARIDLPFSFEFFGERYTTVWAFTNGFLSFEPPPIGITILSPALFVPQAGFVDAFIAPMWADLDRDRAAGAALPEIRSAISGPVGDRSITIQYIDFRRARTPQSDVNFSVVLSEGTGRIRVVYGPNFGIVNATAALEGEGGRDGFDLHRASASCAGACACIPATCGSIPNFPSGLLVTLDLPAAPELVGGFTAPGGARGGETFDAEVTVRNAGLVAAGAFDYAMWLSPSGTSTAGADLLGRFRVGGAGLAPLAGEVTTRTFTVPAATPPSVRFLALGVDVANEVNEAFEANNLVFGPAFRTGPELRGSLTVPMVTGPNETLTVALDVESAGAAVMDSFDVEFLLSADDLPDASDFVLGRVSLTLPDGRRRTGPVEITVPPGAPRSPPDYRVLAVLDVANAIAEIDETNNVVVSGGFIQVRGPELVVRQVRSATVAVRGRPYPVEVVVANEGGAVALGVRACALLGTDAAFDLALDPRLGQTAPFDLRAGDEQRILLELSFPANATNLERFVAGGIDCERLVMEDDETDNAQPRSGPIEVRDPAPDYGIDLLEVSSLLAAGEQVVAQAVLANRGTAPGRPEVVLVLSRDPSFDPADLELARVTPAADLGSGAAENVVFTGLIPETEVSGDVYLIAVADPGDQVVEIDETDNRRSVAAVLSGSGLAIVGDELPPAVIGRPFVWRFGAAGGEVDRAWTLTWAGAPPPGLSFDAAAGELSGIPEEAGEGRNPFSLSVQSGNETARRDFALLVVPPGLDLQVVSRQLPPAPRNASYSAFLTALGGTPPYRWQLQNPDALPRGLVLFPNTGRITGEAALAGASVLQVTVTDVFGRTAPGLVALDVVDAEAGLQITTAAVPSGMVSMPYETRFLFSGSENPVTWSVTGGPPGLAVEASSTGRYFGTPTEAGVFPLVVEVRDSVAMRFDRAAYIVEVVEQGDLSISGGAELPAATVNQAYAAPGGGPFRFQAAPDDGSLRWSILDGALPAGLTLGTDGVLSGTPTILERQAFVIQVRNGRNELRRVTRVLQVTEDGGPMMVEPDGCRGTSSGGTTGLFALLFGLAAGLRALRRR
ncbi:MAG: CARDB domain-containing protein [Myxococcota bacterium]